MAIRVYKGLKGQRKLIRGFIRGYKGIKGAYKKL